MEENQQTPHVLIFPLPLQGPVNCSLKLAELLCLSGIRVTFLNTSHIHRRLLRHNTDVLSRFNRYPNFRFETIDDGITQDEPMTGEQFMEMFGSITTAIMPVFREMIVSGCLSSTSACPITVIIPDGFFPFALDVGREAGIPVVFFETISPCGLLTYLCLSKLTKTGEFPFKGDNLDTPINGVPGMESFLRRRDLPSFFRSGNLDDPLILSVNEEAQQLSLAQGLIINTFEALDARILPHIRSFCPNTYTLGPLHSLHKAKVANTNNETASGSFWEEERSCLSWLDKHSPKSVIYISIGSVATMTVEQMMEIWHGVVESGMPFLWVRRLGSVVGEYKECDISPQLVESTKQRGCIVGWCPQEEVLAHPAIGGFLTHGGWNSTLESMVEGVPMICWPHFVDQQVNSRFVSEVWKLGIDIKDTCDRAIIADAVRDLMDSKRYEFMKPANAMAEMAKESISEHGSSCISLNRLVDDIKSMSRIKGDCEDTIPRTTA